MAVDVLHVPVEPVESSNIKGVGYDVARRILAVQFASGEIYQYADVPEDLAGAFVRAPSIGRFYSSEIRGKFPGTKATNTCAKCGALGLVGERCGDCGCSTIEESPKPIRHWADGDAKRGRQWMTNCGVWVTGKDLAAEDRYVTCDGCKAEMANRNAMRF